MDAPNGNEAQSVLQRQNSVSQASASSQTARSQTAQEFIESQLLLEAEAREALPYQFDTCTRPLGALRQSLFSCLTCNPPPSSPTEPYQAAGICYSCSISCHGEHNLVELFNKRNFVCDCGTTRLPSSSPCTLRVSEATGLKGPVHSEKPAEENSYNQNFQNRFCGCEQDYDVQKEKGTMFQCLGLATIEEGGCGEDWWHPECLVGLPRDWHKKLTEDKAAAVEESKPEIQAEDSRQDVTENGVEAQAPDSHDAILEDFSLLDEDDPLPPGFPQEDDFEQLICYKCLDAFPWIKRYAGSTGFLPPVFRNVEAAQPEAAQPEANTAQQPAGPGAGEAKLADLNESKKRKASPDADVTTSDSSVKRQRSSATPPVAARNCRYEALPPAATGTFTICFNEGFRDQLCKCMSCFPILKDHPYLLEEEALYEPPISSDGDDEAPGSLGSRSLLDRGEAALSNVDRVRAIEGVMVYNHLKDKVKDFLKPFADSKTPVGAEDIKRYFEGLRGDAEAIRTAAAKSSASGNDDNRREQSGY